MRVQLPLSGLYLGFCWSPNGLHALASLRPFRRFFRIRLINERTTKTPIFRPSRLCAAKAKELERMAKADGDMPAMDHASLMDVLKRIDNVMEWRFVNALGEVVLDGDILAESIDCETLRTMHYCVAEYLKRIEEREVEEKSDE